MAAQLVSAVPVLPVASTAPAVAWYVDRLGFREIFLSDGYAIVRRDGVEIHLWQAADESWRGKPAVAPLETGAESFLAGTASCRVRVEGVAELHAAAEAAGIVHPNGPLGDRPWGTREFAVLDRDGNLVTFFEPRG